MIERIPIIANTRDRISPNFYHYEVVKSYDAERNGIDNFVYNSEVELCAKALAENVLEKVREHAMKTVGRGFTPNSWYRCEALERYICRDAFIKWCKPRGIDPQAPDAWFSYFQRKQHPKGASADIEISGISNVDLFNWIKDNLVFDQLILEFVNPKIPNSGWVHVSFDRYGNNRKQAFAIN